jgi:predicted  nucleic acid-binding Zn-ribbon protein
MLPDIERLIALQRLDSAGHAAQRQLAEEPERQRAFDSRLEAVRLKVTAAKEQLAENQNARRAIEKDVAVHQGRLSKFRDQLMSVKTNIEYQAMQKEIEFAQKEVKAQEDKVLERMLEADDLTTALKEAERELAAAQKAVDAERGALTAELAESTRSLERIATERAEVVSALNPKVLALFELIANRRNGVAIAEARDGVCTICHVRLRPQVFNTVRRNDEIVQCDHCNRILYFTPVPVAAPESAEAKTQ